MRRTAGAAYPADREAEWCCATARPFTSARSAPEDEEAMPPVPRGARPGVPDVQVLLGGHGPAGGGPLDGGRRLLAVATAWWRSATRRGGWHRAIYFGDGPDEAEVAFAVADRLQGIGPGHAPARPPRRGRHGERDLRLRAEVMPQNHRMIEVFRESGFPVEMSSEPGAIQVELPTSFADEAVGRFEDRDRLAAQAALRSFLEPRAVAVIGASREPGHRRRAALPQRARVGLRGRRLSGESRAPTWCRRCAPTGASPSCPRTSSWR